MTTQMPRQVGRATLDTMTTAQNRAALSGIEDRALRAAPEPAEESARPPRAGGGPGAARPPGGGEEPEETTGSYDLEARGALRRVAGLSTELADITEVEYRRLR